MTGKIGLVLKLAFEFGVTAEYKYKKGWNFGGGASGTVSLDLAGTIEVWLVKATAYGGAQGYITGTVLSETGDLVVKLGAGGIAGVAVQYRTPFGPWETLANVQAGFLNTKPYTVGTVHLGSWIEQKVESAG